MKYLLLLLFSFTTLAADNSWERQLPVGSTINHAGASCPAGFLLNDGSAKSRTTYSKLFTTIGTKYGIGDGSTTFNVANYLPTIQKFTSGSGTYTTSLSASYIRIKMVGGGGGSGGSGTNGGSIATGFSGNPTTFGTSLLTATAGGGSAGAAAAEGGGAGGNGGTINSPATGTTYAGGNGAIHWNNTQSASITGGAGGSSVIGVPSSGRFGSSAVGQNGVANSGSGASGAGTSASAYSSGGGGGGGFVDAIITNPSLSYSYSVGAGGSGGAAGTSGFAGGSGGSGYIEVTEYPTIGNCIKY
jgi:hypothetical protein